MLSLTGVKVRGLDMRTSILLNMGYSPVNTMLRLSSTPVTLLMDDRGVICSDDGASGSDNVAETYSYLNSGDRANCSVVTLLPYDYYRKTFTAQEKKSCTSRHTES